MGGVVDNAVGGEKAEARIGGAESREVAGDEGVDCCRGKVVFGRHLSMRFGDERWLKGYSGLPKLVRLDVCFRLQALRAAIFREILDLVLRGR